MVREEEKILGKLFYFSFNGQRAIGRFIKMGQYHPLFKVIVSYTEKFKRGDIVDEIWSDCLTLETYVNIYPSTKRDIIISLFSDKIIA